VLAIDKLTQYDTGVDTVSDTELDLRAGRIFFNVKKMSATSQFLIKIPSGVAGIRGSWGVLDSTGDLAMGEGSGVIAIGAMVHVVNAGFQFNSQGGNGGDVTPISQLILNNFRTTLASLITLYQAPGGSPPSGSDSTQNCGSRVLSIQF
jgi:hypothetical protein